MILQRLLQILAAISGNRWAHFGWVLRDVEEWTFDTGHREVHKRRVYLWKLGKAKSRKRSGKAADRRQGVLPMEKPK